jgi:ribonuclease P protein component
MAFGPACGPGAVARSSSTAARKVVDASPHSGRPFISLRGRSSFQRVYREGRRSGRGGITVISVPGRPGPPRIGFVAGKALGSAVARNRAKRRLRAAAERVPFAAGTDYVVIAARSVDDMEFEMLVVRLGEAANGTAGERR